MVQMGLLGWGLRKQGIGLQPCWPHLNGPLRQVAGQYLPTLAGAALINSNILVDQCMATLLERGSVAALNYGPRLVSVAVSVGAVALGGAVLPFYSQMVVAEDWQWIRRSLKAYTGIILLCTIPVTIIGFLSSSLLVKMLFQRGQFTDADVVIVSNVLGYSMLQLPFYAASIPFIKVIASFRANSIFMWGNLVSFVLNIVLDYVLMKVMGVAGIAFATALVLMVAFFYLAFSTYRILRKNEMAGAPVC